MVEHTVTLFEAALGPAVGLRRVMRAGRTIAAVGRWRHMGAQIDLAPLRTTQLVFNLNGGQALEWSRGSEIRRGVGRCGSVSVVGQEASSELRITGAADTIQMVLNPAALAQAPKAHAALSPAVCERRLQALSAQALVALTSNDDERLAITVGAAASTIAELRLARPTRAMGGLALAPLRRVKALVERELSERVGRLSSVSSLADFAGLSLHHFIRAFKVSEGLTPGAWIAARKLDHALHLLLERKAQVGEVADCVGYGSPAHFVSDFRQRLGVTPAQLRDAAYRL